MTTNNFYYAYTLANTLFGIELEEQDFEEIGLVAWNMIGNKNTRLHRLNIKVDCDDNNSVQLPCNLVEIESITRCGEDYQVTTNHTNYDNYDSHFTESYIESLKRNKDPYYTSGGYVKYEQVGDKIYLAQPHPTITILYKGVELDEDGLPSLNDKEALAIATFCAFTHFRKQGLILQNKGFLDSANFLSQDWLRKCDAARVPEYINQNEMNKIIDIKSSYDRKIFNKSFKPIK